MMEEPPDGPRQEPTSPLRAARHWWQHSNSPLLAVAALSLIIHLVGNGVYGFHTDELYYIECGLHPALGYVDFPPVVPLLAWVDIHIFGIHPWTLRLFPAVAVALVVFLAGRCALELGASRPIAVLSAIVVLLTPLLLGTWMFQTVAFDQLTWMIAIYLLLLIVRRRTWGLFIPLGADLGIGFETKTTIAALWAAIFVCVLTSRGLRAALRTRYPWLAAGIAGALAAPTVVWQAVNGFPTWTYVHNHSADIAAGGGVPLYFALFVLTLGPLLLPLWVGGFVLLWRDHGLRPLAVLVLAAIALLVEGKGYYASPTVPLILAAGCVGIGHIVSQARRRVISSLVLLAGLAEAALLAPIILPVVPPSALHRLGVDAKNPDYANTVGWSEMTAQVEAVYRALPATERAHAAILAEVDGAAGAIDIYGRGQGLPPVISPHLSFWYWKPAHLGATTLITVGYRPDELAFLCGSVIQAATVQVPYSVVNLEQGAPILVCSDLREPVDDAWPQLKNFS